MEMSYIDSRIEGSGQAVESALGRADAGWPHERIAQAW